MNFIKQSLAFSFFLMILAFSLNSTIAAQTNSTYTILADKELTRIVPTSFYFAGQSAPTQMRNASAAVIGKDRYVIAGMVDTSGYSTEISGKYEGFLITDSAIKIGDKELSIGAYGFGFSADGKINIFDLSSKEIFSAKTASDAEMRRPRPLMMSSETNGVRLYKGKNYVLISPK